MRRRRSLGRCRWPSLLERQKWIPARHQLESASCHRCRLDSPAGWRGELRRVEWQANDHLLRMRAAARVAASRRHEPDRSKVQPRVAQPRVERSSRGSHCPRSSRGSHWLHVVSPQVTDLVPYYLPCTISSSLYHIIFPLSFLAPFSSVAFLSLGLLDVMPNRSMNHIVPWG